MKGAIALVQWPLRMNCSMQEESEKARMGKAEPFFHIMHTWLHEDQDIARIEPQLAEVRQ